jgi:hypothetical protein
MPACDGLTPTSFLQIMHSHSAASEIILKWLFDHVSLLPKTFQMVTPLIKTILWLQGSVQSDLSFLLQT